ncbi:MAG: hypothetical protein R3E68_21465 [Burkholderiaceae bacterium]
MADEIKAFTILYDCGTPRVFEDGKEYSTCSVPRPTVRWTMSASPRKSRNVQGRQLRRHQPELRVGPGLLGRLRSSMKQLMPKAEVKTSLLPRMMPASTVPVPALLRETRPGPSSLLGAICGRSCCRCRPAACTPARKSPCRPATT